MLHGDRRYVPDLASEAIERPTDLDGGAHKKTRHKRCIITLLVTPRPPTPTCR
jgi:hypothetical protein